MTMDQQLRGWRLDIERVWSADAPDWPGIARLVTDIAGASENLMLRQAATQALPSLRHASVRWADGDARVVARRRPAIGLDVLNALTAPRFGKRGGRAELLPPDQRYRPLL